ncbi:MAG: hypothetical protein KDB61_02260 [Planctomycetes bacterium]|nr:hypothetical protein [Planctomycetota bacterium]
MRIPCTLRLPQASLALLLLASTGLAQWATNPAVNQSVGDGPSDQNLAKIAVTGTGDSWIGWFDGIGNGYDVRLQRLDSNGNEAFAHNGILVSNRSFSSTQDWGMDTAANGDALLAYRDDHLGSTEVGAARVDASGAMLWGPTGVLLTSGAGFVASPKIAGTLDGGAVVAWTENSSVRLQKLDSAGVPVWASPITLTPSVGSYSVADLHDAGNDVILSMVHQTGGFTSPKHLVA